MDFMAERIRAGSRVDGADGYIGVVDRLERDEDGSPRFLRVRRNAVKGSLLVPVGLIRQVRADGGVELQSTIEEAEDANAAGGFGQARAATQETPQVGEAFEQTVELLEEELVGEKEMRDVGEIRVRTVVEEVPGRLEIEAAREEIHVEHVPVGEAVSERVEPWEEDGALIVPVYEEQLVVTKRLVLKEHLRIRRVAVTETELFEDRLQRERLIIEDPNETGLVRELYPKVGGEEAREDRRGTS
jgi:uncharacterized protein (TIGR02271 family)